MELNTNGTPPKKPHEYPFMLNLCVWVFFSGISYAFYSFVYLEMNPLHYTIFGRVSFALLNIFLLLMFLKMFVKDMRAIKSWNEMCAEIEANESDNSERKTANLTRTVRSGSAH